MPWKLTGPGSICPHFDEDEDDPRWQYFDLEMLDVGSKEGCLRCAVMHAALVFWIPGCPPGKCMSLWASAWPESLRVEIDAFRGIETIEIFAAKDGLVAPHLLLTKPIPPGDTGSEASLQTLKGWLDECITSHKELCSPTSSKLPTRVLEITREQEALHVRLFVPEVPTVAPYVCLSYCWGKIRPACLTTYTTLRSYKEGIALDTMPKTFRDTISVVHRLGLRYLWIDSMCIVQDDPDDWQMESSRMADIYQHAFFTIAATGAASGEEGLFFLEDPKLASHPIDMGAFSIFVRKHRSHLVDEPLLKRAWTYQEQLLSPRTVHFAKNELIWQCKMAHRCECGVEKFTSEKPRAEIEIDWLRAVTTYSLRDITFESDKFPALSGIAKATTEWRSGQRYYAGLWEEDMVNGLLWKGLNTPSSRPAEWRAPTWSWASVNGGVSFLSFDYPYKMEHATVTSVQCETIGDPTGRLRSATMRIKGRLAEAGLFGEDVGPANSWRWRVKWPSSGRAVDMQPDYDLSRDRWRAMDVHVLLVADLMSDKNYEGPLHACLVLQRQDDVFGRIGLLELGQKVPQAIQSFHSLLMDAKEQEFTFI